MGCLSARRVRVERRTAHELDHRRHFAALLALSAALLAAFSHSIHVADAFTRKEEQVMVSRYLEGRMRGDRGPDGAVDLG
jgi:mevalonate pyrophosphate decarboxylase